MVMKLARMAPLAIPFVGLGMSVGLLVAEPLSRLTLFIVDDTYYYLRVAQHVASEGRFTFDGIHLTTGFHPLWQLILSGAAFFVSDPVQLVYVSLVLNAILAAIAGVALYFYVRELFGVTSAYIVQIAWSLNTGLLQTWVLIGMENVLYMALLVTFLVLSKRILAARHLTMRWSIGYGVVALLLSLARTDSAALVGIVVISIIYVAQRDHSRDLMQTAIVVATIMAAGFGIYLAANVSLVGYPFQISGAVKMAAGLTAIQRDGGVLSLEFWQNSGLALRSVFGALKWHLMTILLPNGPLRQNIALVLSWLPLGAAFSLAAWQVVRATKDGKFRAMFRARVTVLETAFVTFTTLNTILYVTILRQTVSWTPWYLTPQLLLTIIVISWLLGGSVTDSTMQPHRLLQYSRVWLVAASFLSASLIYSSGVLASGTDAPTWNVEGMKLAQWLESNIPPTTRVGAWDTGLWAYYSQKSIVNLDGLMNDYRFFNEYQRQGRIAEYVDDEHIEYLITWTDDFSQCRAYLIQRCLSGEVVYRTPEWQITGGRAGTQVIRLSPK